MRNELDIVVNRILVGTIAFHLAEFPNLVGNIDYFEPKALQNNKAQFWAVWNWEHFTSEIIVSLIIA